jgi:ketosteroid isomerase-like protein
MLMTESLAEHEVATRRDQFLAALRAHDVDAACSVYAIDADLLPPAANAVHGRSEISRFWQAGLDSGMADIDLESRDLREQNGIAYEIGRYTLRFEPVDGSPVVERGHYVEIHKRDDDGSWQRAVEIFSPGGGE